MAAIVLGVLIATLASYIALQGTFQEAETQTDRQPAAQAPANTSDTIEPSFPEGSQRRFDPGKIIVSIEEDATQADLREVNRENGARIEEDLPRSDVNVVDLPSDLTVREAIAVYENDPDIEYAEPDFLLQPSQTPPAPNDPGYNRLYGLNNTGQNGGTTDADIDASEAWSTTTGDPGTVVAVIDEGVDINHPDLKDNLWVNTDEIPGNGVDDDSNGYVDDVNGFDFANNDASVYDPATDPVTGTVSGDEHGTHVAGTIAAQGNNGVGITGVNYDAQIMSLKFLGATGGYTSDAVEAINYAVSNGAPISNNSWGGGGYSQALRDAIANADAKGHLFVAAAGNGGADGVGDDNDATPHYPSNYDLPNVISVAATDKNDALASFSNFGATSVDLSAPGVQIYSTLPNNTYGAYSGTSMATPHVSGVAALIKSEFPGADDAELRDRILNSVDPKASLTGKTATGGRLNAAGALGTAAILAPPEDMTAPDTGISSGPSGTVKSTTASFGFTASEPVQRFECSLDGAAFAGCASPKSYSGLANGSHTFRVQAIDGAGNVDSSPATRTWTVDTRAPNTGISSGPSGTVRATSASFGLAASEGGSRFECSLDGAAYAACPSPKSYTGLASRIHTFRVRAVDAVGNVDATPASRTWTVDAILPTVGSVVPGAGTSTRDRTPTITAIARDSQTNLQIANVKLYLDGRLRTISYSAATDKLSFTSGANLAYGTHTAKVVVTDVAGNVGSKQWSFKIVR